MCFIENNSDLKQKINRETARILWRDLQRFFAAGTAVRVNQGLDLIEVAQWVSEDNTARVTTLMEGGALAPVSDAEAQRWIESELEVWAVVVKPWVLVQEP